MVILTENHRQGKDRSFADMFNRILVGKQTEEDIQILMARVRPANHPDITLDTTKICSTREEASEFNMKRVNALPGKLYNIEASHLCKSRKNYRPTIGKAGKIADTQFEDILHFKEKGRVMLIYNIAVHDGLCNGAMGTVLALECNNSDSVEKLLSTLIMKIQERRLGKHILPTTRSTQGAPSYLKWNWSIA